MKEMIILLGVMAVFSLNAPELLARDTAIKNAIAAELWERLVYAITVVESHVDDSAVNPKSGAAGRFQMKRIYVDEVNRILRKKKYHYQDRHNPKKAREMFDIYQAHHNPTKDIDRAILIHRGKNVKSYVMAVKENMKK